LMGVTVITSLFYMRPWCKTLCPLRAITDAIHTLRRWVLRSDYSKP
jgi:polyferredoxin